MVAPEAKRQPRSPPACRRAKIGYRRRRPARGHRGYLHHHRRAAGAARGARVEAARPDRLAGADHRAGHRAGWIAVDLRFHRAPLVPALGCDGPGSHDAAAGRRHRPRCARPRDPRHHHQRARRQGLALAHADRPGPGRLLQLPVAREHGRLRDARRPAAGPAPATLESRRQALDVSAGQGGGRGFRRAHRAGARPRARLRHAANRHAASTRVDGSWTFVIVPVDAQSTPPHLPRPRHPRTAPDRGGVHAFGVRAGALRHGAPDARGREGGGGGAAPLCHVRSTTSRWPCWAATLRGIRRLPRCWWWPGGSRAGTS